MKLISLILGGRSAWVVTTLAGLSAFAVSLAPAHARADERDYARDIDLAKSFDDRYGFDAGALQVAGPRLFTGSGNLKLR